MLVLLLILPIVELLRTPGDEEYGDEAENMSISPRNVKYLWVLLVSTTHPPPISASFNTLGRNAPNRSIKTAKLEVTSMLKAIRNDRLLTSKSPAKYRKRMVLEEFRYFISNTVVEVNPMSPSI